MPFPHRDNLKYFGSGGPVSGTGKTPLRMRIAFQFVTPAFLYQNKQSDKKYQNMCRLMPWMFHILVLI